MEMPTAENPVVVHNGDCLDLLRRLPDGCVDAVVTDPPYSSGGAFRGDRQQSTETKYNGWSQNEDGSSRKPTAAYPEFTGDTRDQRGYLTWFGIWAGECLRASRPGAHFFTFTDWRQLPTITDAVQVGGWVWRGLAVWDKGVGRPMKGRFRNHLEYIVWGTNGATGEPQDVYLSNLFQYAPPTSQTRQHRTEKPVDLIRELIRMTPPTGLILDPFAGSGTTGAAAVIEGRRAILIEKEPIYVDVTRRRIAKASGAGSLFAGATN